jgi:small subunit ribosomal protein S9
VTDEREDEPRDGQQEEPASRKEQPSEPAPDETQPGAEAGSKDALTADAAVEAEVEPAEEVAAAEEPEAAAEEPVATETPEAPAEAAEAPEEPVAAEEPAAAAEEPAAAAEEPAAAAEEPAAAAEAPQEPVAAGEPEEIEIAPRQKPEIPGADLEPDIVPEGDEFLDAEAQAAAEAEAEAAAARAQEEADQDVQPIADAAIDLAAGARYTATGKRKTAVARVILKPGTGTYAINGRTLESAFPRETLQRVIRQPLETVGYDSRMDVVARMHGGGVAAQAGALRHGISRALIVADPNLRGELKRRGFLTRDPRVKERKKAGLKKARKRPQFSKR